MGYINLPDNLQSMFATLESRLTKLEMSARFTLPNVTADPTTPRNGDLWLNTTSNTPKYVDSTGAVKSLTSSGVPYGPRYMKTGYQYGPISAGAFSNSALTASLLTAVPIYVPNAITVTSLMINIGATNGASSGVRVGIYTNSASDDYPNQLVAGSDQFIPTDTVSASAGAAPAAVSLSLSAGLYWLAGVKQGTGAPSVSALTTLNYYDYAVMPYSATTGGGIAITGMVAWSATPYTGALPATFPATKTPTSSASACVWITV